MTAAVSARTPLFQEGSVYWQDLVTDCRRQAHAFNAVASEHGVPHGHLIECRAGQELHISKARCPSTAVKLRITYCSWGPMIDGIITGLEEEDREFCPEEFTVPIAKDLDGSIVAIYDEGRSFSPHELASFVMQSFRRCYPGLSLPCEEAVV